MGRRWLGVPAVFSVLALGFVACDSEQAPSVAQRPIDAEEATDTVTQRVDSMLTGLSDASAELDTTDSTTVATDGVSTALGNRRCGDSNSNDVATESTNAVDAIPDSTTRALSDALIELRDEAKAHVFRQDLVESEDGNQVVYKLAPSEICDGDSECVERLSQNPLRFAVTANQDDSLNVALLVGEDRHSPATAVLAEDRFSVRGNLAEVMDSLRLFMSAEEQQDLPDTLSGVVEWSIDKRAEGDFVFSASVLERIDLKVGQNKGKPVSVSVEPSSPTTQIGINSFSNTVSFRQNVGAIDVSVAGSAVCKDMDCGDKENSGTFGLHLGGFTGEFETTGGARELTFSGLGLGSSTSSLSINGQPLVAVDLNPDQGRKFSVNFKKTDAGTLVTFEPALDLSLAMTLSNLSESMRVDMPDWLFDEVFDVTLGGAAKPSILIPAPSCNPDGTTTSKEQLQVVTGSLALSATSLPNAVEVSANQCLLPLESTASEPHPFSLLTAGVCE